MATAQNHVGSRWTLDRCVKASIYVVIVVVIISATATTRDLRRTSKSDAEVARVSFTDALRSGRQRRAVTPLSQTQRELILEQHNTLRAQEGAANMEVMLWSESMTSLAATWAENCVWKHPRPLADYPEYNGIGQNLCYRWGSKVSAEPADDVRTCIDDFYKEKSYYNYDTLKCTAGKVCGHYTQLVWWNSREVGCAVHTCDTLANTKTPRTNVFFLVCNYKPTGNYVGLKPFIKGPTCSKCASGAGWCTKKLCNSECSASGENCQCCAICHNCAKINTETCKCACAAGWRGPDCSAHCKDTHPKCYTGGWPSITCKNEAYSYRVREGCPVMCKMCKPDPNAEEGKCEPERGACYGSTAYTDNRPPTKLLSTTSSAKSHQETATFEMVTTSSVKGQQEAATFAVVTIVLHISCCLTAELRFTYTL